MHVGRQSDPDVYLQFAVDGGATTVRDDVSWAFIETTPGTYDWSGPDDTVTRAANHGLHVLLIVDTAPSWASGISTSTASWYWYPPQSASDYGSFAGQVAARYGASGTFWSANPSVPKVLPAGIELWNEPNLTGFWQSGPDPAKYAAMVKAAYPAIKAADPSMVVVTAGLSPHGGYDDANCDNVPDTGADANGMSAVNFVEALYASGAGGYFDALGMHPYNFWSGATAAQMLSYHVCSAWSQMSDTTPSLRSPMVANGDGAKRIWATELGAPTCIASATYTCVDESAQADLGTQEVALWKSYAWAGNYYWYDLRDDSGGTSTTDREQHFGVVRGDDSMKPAWDALRVAWGP